MQPVRWLSRARQEVAPPHWRIVYFPLKGVLCVFPSRVACVSHFVCFPPGTALMATEAALCLALDLPSLPGKAGGVMTPAACMGQSLVRARTTCALARPSHIPPPPYESERNTTDPIHCALARGAGRASCALSLRSGKN